MIMKTFFVNSWSTMYLLTTIYVIKLKQNMVKNGKVSLGKFLDIIDQIVGKF